MNITHGSPLFLSDAADLPSKMLFDCKSAPLRLFLSRLVWDFPHRGEHLFFFFYPPHRPSLCPRCFEGHINSCIAVLMRTTSRLAWPWEPPSRVYASRHRIIFIIPSVLCAEMKVKILHLTSAGEDAQGKLSLLLDKRLNNPVGIVLATPLQRNRKFASKEENNLSHCQKYKDNVTIP